MQDSNFRRRENCKQGREDQAYRQGKKISEWKIEAIKFFSGKWSKGKIARELEVGKNTVNKYVK